MAPEKGRDAALLAAVGLRVDLAAHYHPYLSRRLRLVKTIESADVIQRWPCNKERSVLIARTKAVSAS